MNSITAIIRLAADADLAPVNDIYNHYVRSSHATFDLEPRDIAWRRQWFVEHSTGRHRVYVGVNRNGVLGFASSSPYRPRPAYDTTVETSVYVAPDSVGRGVGAALYSTLLYALANEDVHRAVAGIALPNVSSVALHRRLGFVPIGRFTGQGRKFGRYWDVEWYERSIP